jgi:hypothetical protein
MVFINIKISQTIVGCTACTTVVTLAHGLVRQNATAEVLTKVVRQICPYADIPKEWMPKVCPRMIELFAPVVIEVFLSRREIQPKYICHLLGMCEKPEKINHQQFSKDVKHFEMIKLLALRKVQPLKN